MSTFCPLLEKCSIIACNIVSCSTEESVLSIELTIDNVTIGIIFGK